ncbi:hypothetical protein [Flavobacterium sp. J27]|uniref:hypothetical protein n=1 Tax=Flavobacterium sp. J27 TaxID=2060419 RepID=UPI001F0EBFE2|nr:hypothetical protein [Flavobacterium sp. J27]
MKYYDSNLFQVIISLRLLKEKFDVLLNSDNHVVRFQAKLALELFEKNPELINGFTNSKEFFKKKKEIDQLMSFIFPTALNDNEIKAAVFPYSNDIFYCSNRLQKIIENSVSDNHIFDDLYKDIGGVIDLLAYAIILNVYYKYEVDFDRPKTISVIDKNGIKKRYRVTFNADFLDIYPNENALDITEEVLTELLSNTNDTAIWRKYFPEKSWTIEGFGLISLIDTTLDEQIDDFKSHLIETNKESLYLIREDIRKIFNLPNLQLGTYNVNQDTIIPPYDSNFEMLTLLPQESLSISQYGCDKINNELFQENKVVIISNVDLYHKQTGGNRLSDLLLERKIKSVALIPILVNEKLEFIIELASNKANQLNAINMVKLDVIMPFILSYSERSIAEYRNEISAVIQQECTSIHPSVQWRFEEEANKYIQERNHNDVPVFEEIVFKDVLPLYGQIDIVGSSNARNEAIREDLSLQLLLSRAIIQSRLNKSYLPFYEQLIFEIDNYHHELKEEFHTNSEQRINLFFEKQIFPLLEHLVSIEINAKDISDFLNKLEIESKTIYQSRKEYDCTVDATNKALSTFLDKQQNLAQEIFPHYFEKFKTDGVEHNIYIGASINKHLKYHESALFNLRLWQLQVTCEMEAMFYKMQKDFLIKLDVASLILAYDVPITIRYRMDEKRFDVDGAYNVRYEMIKKRIDKAHIKNTNERLTQPNKLCVVYSSSAIEQEYLKYFEFLQSKNYVGNTVEILELEELQGVSGIKAIRIDMNRNLKKEVKLFTIEDL